MKPSFYGDLGLGGEEGMGSWRERAELCEQRCGTETVVESTNQTVRFFGESSEG
jgi:hypothetical protein